MLKHSRLNSYVYIHIYIYTEIDIYIYIYIYMRLQFEDEQDCSQATSQKACDNEGEVGVFHRSGPHKLSDCQNCV